MATFQKKTQEKARIPEENENSRRTESALRPQTQGPQTLDRNSLWQITFRVKKLGFSRKERLKKSGEFVRVLRSGKKLRAQFLALSYQEFQTGTPLKDGPASFSRLGIIVPKRVFKKATARNKMKRWLREAFRHEKSRLKPGYNLVIQVSHLPEYADFHAVKEIFSQLLLKSGLLK